MRAMTHVWRVIFLLNKTGKNQTCGMRGNDPCVEGNILAKWNRDELNLWNGGNDPCVEGNKTEKN